LFFFYYRLQPGGPHTPGHGATEAMDENLSQDEVEEKKIKDLHGIFYLFMKTSWFLFFTFQVDDIAKVECTPVYLCITHRLQYICVSHICMIQGFVSDELYFYRILIHLAMVQQRPWMKILVKMK
jgi:hypothetical protein